jgi:serine/threonine protein kinase
MPFDAGTRLGPYEIIAPLGAGGMGEVYRARDTRLDRTVAVKVLTRAFAADVETRQRFEHEARVIAALNDPHICTIYDVGRYGELDYLVLEYVEGETLADRLKRSGLAVDDAIAIAVQIGDALDKASSRRTDGGWLSFPTKAAERKSSSSPSPRAWRACRCQPPAARRFAGRLTGKRSSTSRRTAR